MVVITAQKKKLYNKQNLSQNELESLERIYGKGDCYSNTKKLYALSIPKLPVVPCLWLKHQEKFEIHGKVWTVERERGNNVIILCPQNIQKRVKSKINFIKTMCVHQHSICSSPALCLE